MSWEQRDQATERPRMLLASNHPGQAHEQRMQPGLRARRRAGVAQEVPGGGSAGELVSGEK